MGAKPKVVVAMSGGVDSSLTAALLVRAGYEAIGITMRLSDEGREADERGCCTLRAAEDARRVAEFLGIAHYVVNFKTLFQKTVVDYFIDEYAQGRTPNPCIACNRHVKFEGLLQRALELDAPLVATGHYARIERDAAGRYLLKKGVDAAKDQSYVLYHLNQETLRHFLMPLGAYTKEETRRLAAALCLPVANKPESQDICFVPDDDYKAYLEKHAPGALRPGEIVDQAGNVLGRHGGLPLYTVGQRRGLGIVARRPLYVTELDAKRNRVIVGGAQDVFSRALIATDLHWIAARAGEAPLVVEAKVRYGAKEGRATVYPLQGGAAKVVFDEPQRAVTPGQSVVFYNGDAVVGGGIIQKSVR